MVMTRDPQSSGASSRQAGMEQFAGKYMTFKLANEIYGLEILNVREIIGLMEITRVPRTPPHVTGVINLRGKVHPVLDLRLKFGMDRTEPTDQTVIIVVQTEMDGNEVHMGILVDEVLEVANIELDQLEPPPTFGTGAFDTNYILGVGKVDKRVIFLLNIGKIINVTSS